MLNQKGLIPILILVLAVSGVISVVAMSPRETHPRGPEADWQPLHYELGSQNANVTISLEQAVGKVRDVWPVPSGIVARSTIIRDDLEDYTYWMLDWSSDGSPLLSASVDANTGKVLVIVDFRRSGGVDNLKEDESRAIQVGEEVLANLQVRTDGLSKPVIKKRDMPHATSWKLSYAVLWSQTCQGLMVKGAAVSVGIDAETLKPVGFSNHLLDVQNVNVVPAISEAQAIEAVEKYVQSEAISSRGYEQCEVRNLELVVERPNHDLTLDKILVPLGDPTLVWYVHVRDAIRGWLIDVMVDAQTGAVVGLIFGL